MSLTMFYVPPHVVNEVGDGLLPLRDGHPARRTGDRRRLIGARRRRPPRLEYAGGSSPAAISGARFDSLFPSPQEGEAPAEPELGCGSAGDTIAGGRGAAPSRNHVPGLGRARLLPSPTWGILGSAGAVPPHNHSSSLGRARLLPSRI
jgi:hypothetical protein